MYTVLLNRNVEAPGYPVIVSELPICFSQGETLGKAIEISKEAIPLHLEGPEGLEEDNEEFPSEVDAFIIASVEVDAPAVIS